jgi:two-component system OmpR family response regulator
MSQAPYGHVLIVEDDASLASGLARGLAQAGYAVTLCSSGEQALVALRLGAMMDTDMRILIVEDDSTLGSGLVRILQAEGYAVDLMPRGEQAVLAAERERFDLVILDVGLPGIDGFEVLRRLREGAQRMPVLVLTARDTVDDRVHGLDLGADDYMAKPFAMPELAARVRALIRRSQAQSGPRVVHGPLALDTVARRAFLRGAPLELAAREWAVLEVLLARVERIVSKESIIQAVASWGDELSPNAIEVYVSRLRGKLEPAGIRIRTVRGFGYMLEEYAEVQ